MTTKQSQKVAQSFLCEKCHYRCCKQSDFNKHLLTAKHNILQNTTLKSPKIATTFSCDCGKTYKHHSSLWKHKKKCSQINNNNNNNNNNIVVQENPEEKPSMMDIITQNKEIMDVLIAQNKEQAAIIKEQSDTIKELIPKIGNNNTTNNNNQFNLQVFLNEDCKDAINFSDFIKQIQVSFEDLENQAENGYINGISKLFIDNLQELGTHKRPIHCTDKKRKTLYIKENNEWDKEGSQNTLKKGIRDVSMKTMKCLFQEKEENQEEYDDIESDFSQKYLLIKRSLLPKFPQDTTINKVIEQISKNSGITE